MGFQHVGKWTAKHSGFYVFTDSDINWAKTWPMLGGQFRQPPLQSVKAYRWVDMTSNKAFYSDRHYWDITVVPHYNDVIMGTMASQTTSQTTRSKKTSKLRVTGPCAGKSPGSVNSSHKGPVTRKMFPSDDVIIPSLNQVYIGA